jgi:phage shock protein PspC (stress-responsive transcriptional regulator)
MVGGVCGGLAEYLGVDVTVVRIIWALFALFGGTGLVAYLACLIVIKENPNQDVANRKKNQNTGLIIGIVLIFSGLAIFSSRWNWGFTFYRPFFPMFRPWFFDWNFIFPLLIIAIGIYYIYHTMKKDRDAEVTKRKIVRDSEDKMIGGVCSGLADYLKVDPAFVRVLWILVTVFSGVILGVIAYIVLLIVLPEGDAEEMLSSEKPVKKIPPKSQSRKKTSNKETSK